MSDHLSGQDDLELQAIQRELDDAFETTRPRAGFEDELWLRMQARRPVWTRLGDALAGFVQGVRELPAVPGAAVATILVVLLGTGIVLYSGLGHGGSQGGAATSGPAAAGSNFQSGTAQFGAVPSPAAVPGSKTNRPTVGLPADGALAEFPGPFQATWQGKLDVAASSAIVYRYQEPSTKTADAFAAGLGAALSGRPPNVLGSYTAATYSLSVTGTVQAPAASPAYFILSTPAMPEVTAAGATPEDVATIFLAEHSLTPRWPYTVAVDKNGDVVRVRYERNFQVGAYAATLVDSAGDGYGIEVDLQNNRPLRVAGILPIDLAGSTYPIIGSEAAVRGALAQSAPAAPGVPVLRLTNAALVYVLVPAGDHSFYEPAYLFSGSLKLNGSTYVKHVLVPAVAQ